MLFFPVNILRNSNPNDKVERLVDINKLCWMEQVLPNSSIDFETAKICSLDGEVHHIDVSVAEFSNSIMEFIKAQVRRENIGSGLIK